MAGPRETAALRVPPPPDRRINDYAGALSAAEREALERKLVAAEGATRNQVVVATFRSLEGESLEDYSIRLAQAWRVGQKGLDNGVIFLVFVDDRRMRLEVGYGLEPTLTDAIASSILRDVVAPRFREGRLADGISAGLDAILQAIAGEYRLPAGTTRQRQGSPPYEVAVATFVAMIIVGFVIVGILREARARRRGWTGTSHG
ncbi:MAG TPA: TPM domain-containing protein, partial [Methylomirabilota bacterium]|nr:TPM domain-containing protein [Methylomirabilota bacterium]